MNYKVVSTIVIILVLVVIGFFGGAFDSTPTRSGSQQSNSSDSAFKNVGK